MHEDGSAVASAGVLRAFGTLAMVGGATLTVGAVAVDLGRLVGMPPLQSVGFALSAASGLGLLFLPIGLYAGRLGGSGFLAKAGAACLALGIVLASSVDVPSVFDPADVEAGSTFGPVGLVSLSVGFLAWFAAISKNGTLGGWRRWVFLVAGLWFFATFPTVQLPLFVAPTGRPSFVLLAGVLGVLQVLMGAVVREEPPRGPPA